LVRLSVNLEETESALWLLEPSTLDYEIVNNRIIFAMSCETEVRVLVVAAKVVDGAVKFRQMRHVVTLSNDTPTPTPPEDEDEEEDEDEDEPTPVRDWSDVTDWVLSRDEPKEDPNTAKAWKEALEKAVILMEGKSLEQQQKIVGDLRRNVFIDREIFSTNWNPILRGIDKQVKKNLPKNSQEYIALIKAILKGLK